VSYDDVYSELDQNEAYHLKLVDGGLLAFQYSFDAAGKLTEHRLAYFPCPTLPSAEDAPALYEQDELYGTGKSPRRELCDSQSASTTRHSHIER
jgi:hypothetical protein